MLSAVTLRALLHSFPLFCLTVHRLLFTMSFFLRISYASVFAFADTTFRGGLIVRKIYVPDTNVPIHVPYFIFTLEDNNIAIPIFS